MEKSWYRTYSGRIDWQAILMVGGAVVFLGLIAFNVYSHYGNFEVSSADGITTRKTIVNLEEGQRFVDVKYACTKTGCDEKIVYTDGGKTAPKTYYIKTVSNLGITSRMTVVVEK